MTLKGQMRDLATGTRHLRPRTKVMLFLLTMAIGQAGCTSSRSSIRSIWDQVPTVRWTGRLLESETRAGVDAKGAEPAVAANVAVKVDSENEKSASDDTTTESPASKPVASRQGSWFEWPKEQIEPNHDRQSSSGELTTDSSRSDSAMERLNAALFGETRPRQALPEHSLTTLDERVQVDALLSEAKSLLEGGQFDQALAAAQKAKEVGDAAHLEYLPDEERPSDLVSRIEGHREAVRLNIDLKSEDFAGQSSIQDDTNRETAPDLQKETAETKDGRGLNRIRRDLSTLFRREKKAGSTENAPPAEKPLQTTSADGARSRKNSNSSVSDAREAIVMANRSVSLGPPEDSDPASFEVVPSDRVEVASESSLSIPPPLDDPDDDSPDEPEMATRTLSPNRSIRDADVASIPADFESVDSGTGFQDMNAPPSHRSRDDGATREPLREADWTIYYIVFGVATLYAVRCYRRGAT